MIGTVTLNPSVDMHIRVKKLVKDDANRAESVTNHPGGKGINVSKVVRELGGKTRAYALTGGFPGEFLKDLARRLDFPVLSVPIEGDTRINAIFTDVLDGTQTRISAPGPKIAKRHVDRLKKWLCRARPKPFLWAFGGSLAQGMPDTTYRDLICALQAEGVPCVLDTDDAPLRRGIEARPFMIKPNEYEMQRLMGRNLTSISDHYISARSLVKRGIRIVVVSLAAKGALFVTEREAFHASGIDVPVSSKVGAGDSLIGGFVYGLARGWKFKDAAKLGIAASTSAVMREAPRLCLKRDISTLIRRVRFREL